jgi:hypothetical protein
MTMTPVRSAAPLRGQTVSSGEGGSGLLIDQVRNGVLYLDELWQFYEEKEWNKY